MAEDTLKKWVKSQRKIGYSDSQIKSTLIKQGYSPKKINNIMNQGVGFSYKEFFKPSFFKLFLPVLFLILIIISVFINLMYLDSFFEGYVNNRQYFDDARSSRDQADVIRLRADSDPNEVIELFQDADESIKKAELEIYRVNSIYGGRILFANAFNFGVTMVYPFFPNPCELGNFVGASRVRNCMYYSDSGIELSNLARRANEDIESSSAGLSTASIFGYLPSDREFSFFTLFLHTLIILILSYFLICFISYCNKRSIAKDVKTKSLIILALFLIILFIMLVFNFDYILIVIPFLVLFSILSYIKKESIRRGILIFSILLLFLSLFLGYLFVEKNIQRGMQRDSREYEVDYKVVYCDNTELVTSEEKLTSGWDNTLDYLRCNNPDCSELCRDSCGEQGMRGIYNGIGSKPYCICGC